MAKQNGKRIHNAELYVDSAARPGWLTGAERVPAPGEEIYCAAGAGELVAVLGKTSDGSRLLEIRLPDPRAKPFFATGSNVLVAPVPATPREEPSAAAAPAAEVWLG